MMSLTESRIALTRCVSVAVVTKSNISRSLLFPWLRNLLRMNFLKNILFNSINVAYICDYILQWQEEMRNRRRLCWGILRFEEPHLFSTDPDKSLNFIKAIAIKYKETYKEQKFSLKKHIFFELLSVRVRTFVIIGPTGTFSKC